MLSILAIILLFSAHALAADRYPQVAARMKALGGSPFSHVFSLGESGKGRRIDAVMLSDSGSTSPAPTRVLVIGGQHGDEVSPVYAMLDLAEEVSQGRNPKLAALLRKTAIVIVPVVNPDGFAADRRCNSHVADLNRSWQSTTQPEVCSMQSLVNTFKPQVVIDLHEWMDRNPMHTNCVEVAGFGSGPQRRLARILSAFARHRMAKQGTGDLRTVFYHKESDTRLAHRHFANQGICSMLIETSSGQPRDVRMRIYREFVTAVVQTLAESNDPRVAAQLTELSRMIGAPDPEFARMYEPRPAKSPGVGDISCWIVIVAATTYIVVRCMGAKGKRANETPVFGRFSSMHPQIYRLPLTEVVQANIPLRARVALMQQQRVRPSDRGKSVEGAGKAA